MLAAVIEQHRDEIEALCRRFSVARLEVFGSAADGTFDPKRSDLDFLVEYEQLSPSEHYEAYFGLWEDLQALFHRKVDLIEPHTMRNPYFIKEVNATRKPVYAA
ncbi:MAG: nucleotidyltransferase domain-containing protein [Planctomycetota bacterium]